MHACASTLTAAAVRMRALRSECVQAQKAVATHACAGALTAVAARMQAVFALSEQLCGFRT
eukprot:13678567-Alexandrium_andersonii.AAC.1